MNKLKSFLLGIFLVFLGFLLTGLSVSLFGYIDRLRYPDCWVKMGLGFSNGLLFVCKNKFLIGNIWSAVISFMIIEILMLFLWLKLSRKMKLVN